MRYDELWQWPTWKNYITRTSSYKRTVQPKIDVVLWALCVKKVTPSKGPLRMFSSLTPTPTLTDFRLLCSISRLKKRRRAELWRGFFFDSQRWLSHWITSVFLYAMTNAEHQHEKHFQVSSPWLTRTFHSSPAVKIQGIICNFQKNT